MFGGHRRPGGEPVSECRLAARPRRVVERSLPDSEQPSNRRTLSFMAERMVTVLPSSIARVRRRNTAHGSHSSAIEWTGMPQGTICVGQLTLWTMEMVETREMKAELTWCDYDSPSVRKLVGSDRDYRTPDSSDMYRKERGSKGWELQRVGATDGCIVCGLPPLPGVLTFAHIHMRDLHLSPGNDPTRVFSLCWHHHHGCYDQGYISTFELLEAEEVWLENRRRPKPHRREIELMRRVTAGEVDRNCVWAQRRSDRAPTFQRPPIATQIRLF
jgi:hypothetical protein